MGKAQRTVLIIDDDDAVRDSIVLCLREEDFRVLEASDGAQGLDIALAELPSIVVCDLKMPGLDGLGVLQALSESEVEIPVIVISGAGHVDDVVQALRLGASDYFVKPLVDMKLLVHAIERATERVQLVADNRRYRDELERANRELTANLRVLEQDQQAGRHVQMRLLPPSPQTLGDFTFCHRVIPSFYLSGDFIEYLLVGDNHITFLVADISGHGASSAFATALLKDFTAHQRSDYNRHNVHTVIEPIAFLKRANVALIDSGIGKHMTMCLGVIDIQNNTLRYSVAGHLPLPILITEEKTEYLPGRGMPVGLFPEAEYTEQVIELPEKFTLCMFSDGILEILPPKELMDKERYLIDRLQDSPAGIEELIQRFGVNEVKELPDDVAVLMVSKG
ncbi:MAG: SpoIIE family protein phosphatase [Pseudomonadales bacterium]